MRIFVPVNGIMAAIPYLAALVAQVAGSLLNAIGADPAIAATSLIAVDMGGYQTVQETAGSGVVSSLSEPMSTGRDSRHDPAIP
ncbi:ethanolamine utilization protein EutH [Saccharopolyspora sp. NPDC049357]|uniref:ethanolamine utilization protein EutH n=1 Tax=Saccharopolyspora sp. NPDC049357 TaxID=3154507 RepID=UPI00343EA517